MSDHDHHQWIAAMIVAHRSAVTAAVVIRAVIAAASLAVVAAVKRTGNDKEKLRNVNSRNNEARMSHSKHCTTEYLYSYIISIVFLLCMAWDITQMSICISILFQLFCISFMLLEEITQ